MKLIVHLCTESLRFVVEKYLGLSVALGCSTDEQFDHIVDTSKKLVAGRDTKLLSSAGREMLIKSVC